MKITDTLDQLLRALLQASEDDARESSSTPGVASSESAGTETPIRGVVPAWRATEDAEPDRREGGARAGAGAGFRFTTTDAGVAETSEHALPDWVRRSQERPVAPVEPETVPREAASIATDTAPGAIEEPSHVEVAQSAGPETVGSLGTQPPAAVETAPLETEPSEPAWTSPVETEPSVVAETARVEPMLSSFAQSRTVEAEPSVPAEAGSVEAELAAAGEWPGPVWTELSVVDAPRSIEAEPPVGESPGALETRPVTLEDSAPVESDPFTAEEPDVADVQPSADVSLAVEHPAATLEPASTPIEIEPVVAVVAEEPTPVEPEDATEAMSESTEVELLAGAELAHLETAAGLAESLNLGFHLGLAVERIATAAAQGSAGVPALREATWLIDRYVALLQRRPIGADLHVSAARLARTGEVIAGMRAIAAALDAASAESPERAGEASDDDS